MRRNRIAGLLWLVITGISVPLTATTGETASIFHEIRIGLLYHDLGVWSGTSREDDGIDYNAELIFSPSLEVLGGSVRPIAGFSLNDSGGTSKVYAGGVYEYIWSNKLFVDLGLGLVLHNGETDSDEETGHNLLGSPVLFRISIEPGYSFNERHRISLMFDHVSNGYLADPNEGLDTLGIRYGYRF